MLKVNGIAYGWGDVDVGLPGLNLQVQEVSYSDAQDKEAIYGLGNKPRGFGQGNYSSEGKLGLLKDDFDELVTYCRKSNITLYGLVLDKVIVSYANETQPTRSDVLHTVTITKVDQKIAQGDKSIKIDLDLLIVGGIERDGLQPV